MISRALTHAPALSLSTGPPSRPRRQAPKPIRTSFRTSSSKLSDGLRGKEDSKSLRTSSLLNRFPEAGGLALQARERT